MNVGKELLDLARAGAVRSLFVVGTGKNVGKTVAVRAIVESAAARGLTFGLTSIGRDGEAVDVADAGAKPRLFLRPGAIIATARDALARHPATEMLDLSDLRTAAGTLVYARVASAGYFEIVGPPTASGVRTCVERFAALGCEQTIVDGAVDRVAALAGGSDAIVVATGASNATTMHEAVGEIQALVARLRVPAYDRQRPFVRVDGALTPGIAAQFAAQRETRQIVVRHPTQIAMSGKAFLGVAERLTLRCEEPLHVVAATVASIGRERYFEPRAFARAVADATNLPTFDVYASARAA
ncbi:MAG: hypothetical protein ACXVAS_14080 [Vulcanimicrobiaceae bacterium]